MGSCIAYIIYIKTMFSVPYCIILYLIVYYCMILFYYNIIFDFTLYYNLVLKYIMFKKKLNCIIIMTGLDLCHVWIGVDV